MPFKMKGDPLVKYNLKLAIVLKTGRCRAPTGQMASCLNYQKFNFLVFPLSSEIITAVTFLLTVKNLADCERDELP